MELKLKLVLKKIPWSLVIKAGILTILWAYFSWWLLVLVALGLFYQGENDPILSYNKTLASLLIISLAIKYLPEEVKWALLILIFTSFFLLLGLKKIVLVKKAVIFRFLHLLLFLGVLMAWFWWSFFSTYLIWQFIFLALISYWLFGDLARVIAGEKQVVLWGGLATFLILQIVYGISLLPIEFINKAALGFLIVVVIQEFLVVGERGRQVGANFYLFIATIFTLLFLVILWMSSWGVV